jgi:hypothetical protein
VARSHAQANRRAGSTFPHLQFHGLIQPCSFLRAASLHCHPQCRSHSKPGNSEKHPVLATSAAAPVLRDVIRGLPCERWDKF